MDQIQIPTLVESVVVSEVGSHRLSVHSVGAVRGWVARARWFSEKRVAPKKAWLLNKGFYLIRK